jgi:hypothetical protein
VIDALARRYLEDVSIAACVNDDLDCTQPTAYATTDRDGEATVTVPANFSGYMQQTERSDYTPAMYFMLAQLPDDGRLRNFPLIPSGSFDGLHLALGTRADSTRGHAMLIVEDCTGLTLSGISFMSPQSDTATTEFYVVDQIPTTSASETSTEGDGGFTNLPPGIVQITATNKKTGVVINTISLLIRAGTITTAYIRPASRGTSAAAAAGSL